MKTLPVLVALVTVVLAVGCSRDAATSPPPNPAAVDQPTPMPLLGSASSAPPPTPTKPAAPAATVYTVVVVIFDLTERRPMPKQAAAFVAEHGSFPLSMARVQVAGCRLGQRRMLTVFPDASDANKIDVQFGVSEGMNPAGSQRDAVMVTVYDETVVVGGLPIAAANDSLELTFPSVGLHASRNYATLQAWHARAMASS